MNSKLGICSR